MKRKDGWLVLVIVSFLVALALAVASFAYLVVGDWKWSAIAAWLTAATLAAMVAFAYLDTRLDEPKTT
jgi:hypothetical protein